MKPSSTSASETRFGVWPNSVTISSAVSASIDVVDLVHRALLHEQADDVDGLLRHAVGEFLDRDDLRDRSPRARSSRATAGMPRRTPRIALALAAQRRERTLALLLVEQLVDGEAATLATVVGTLTGARGPWRRLDAALASWSPPPPAICVGERACRAEPWPRECRRLRSAAGAVASHGSVSRASAVAADAPTSGLTAGEPSARRHAAASGGRCCRRPVAAVGAAAADRLRRRPWPAAASRARAASLARRCSPASMRRRSASFSASMLGARPPRRGTWFPPPGACAPEGRPASRLSTSPDERSPRPARRQPARAGAAGRPCPPAAAPAAPSLPGTLIVRVFLRSTTTTFLRPWLKFCCTWPECSVRCQLTGLRPLAPWRLVRGFLGLAHTCSVSRSCCGGRPAPR